jgi:GNAT superfamily N-acetyltransferase
MVFLRPAQPEEVSLLSDLCLRSKAVWGYDADFLEACRAELTILPRDLETSQIQVAEIAGQIAGIAQIRVENHLAYLDKLFIDPAHLRSGIGRLLYHWAERCARQQGATCIMIEADPEAAPFYRRMGAINNGTAASRSIPGRALPKLRVDLQTIPRVSAASALYHLIPERV